MSGVGRYTGLTKFASNMLLVGALVLLMFGIAVDCACSPGDLPSVGVIQMMGSTCTPTSVADKNALTALCGPAFKVDVNGSGVVSLTPLQQYVHDWSGPGPEKGTFQCVLYTLTGLLAANKKSADLVVSPGVLDQPARLVATGPKELTLTMKSTFSAGGTPPKCSFKYSVVVGCVMGIKAPAKAPACPPGKIVRDGGYANFCALCPPGTASTTPGSYFCNPCSRGTSNNVYGGSCTKCTGSTYAPGLGAVSCLKCNIDAWRTNKKAPPRFTNGRACPPCPPNSYALSRNPSQCVACSKWGSVCCRTSPTRACPGCGSGATLAKTIGPGNKCT